MGPGPSRRTSGDVDLLTCEPATVLPLNQTLLDRDSVLSAVAAYASCSSSHFHHCFDVPGRSRTSPSRRPGSSTRPPASPRVHRRRWWTRPRSPVGPSTRRSQVALHRSPRRIAATTLPSLGVAQESTSRTCPPVTMTQSSTDAADRTETGLSPDGASGLAVIARMITDAQANTSIDAAATIRRHATGRLRGAAGQPLATGFRQRSRSDGGDVPDS